MAYAGKCWGGPMDGQMLAHTSKTYELLKPVLHVEHWMRPLEEAEIIPTKIGEYYWGKNSRWVWLPEDTKSRRTA